MRLSVRLSPCHRLLGLIRPEFTAQFTGHFAAQPDSYIDPHFNHRLNPLCGSRSGFRLDFQSNTQFDIHHITQFAIRSSLSLPISRLSFHHFSRQSVRCPVRLLINILSTTQFDFQFGRSFNFQFNFHPDFHVDFHLDSWFIIQFGICSPSVVIQSTT